MSAALLVRVAADISRHSGPPARWLKNSTGL